MTEYNPMFEKFQMLLNSEKGVLIAQLGTPDFTFPSFAVYQRNQLWMVLYFQEVQKNNEFYSLLKAVTFYDLELKLLWSIGLQLMPGTIVNSGHKYKTVHELIRTYGYPHAEIGGGSSTLQYLAEDGHFVFVKYQQNEILEISSASFDELVDSVK